MFTENKNFYPTPQEIIIKMIEKIEKEKALNILEPSAGKGNLIEGLNEYNKYYNKIKINSLDCLEIDNNLRAILKDKKFNLIGSDFLNFNTYKEYDLILMNPPFENGEKHLLKAISLIENSGGQIICLLNAETLKNPYSNYRKVLMNKLENAEIELIKNAFGGAERKTNVEVALINLKINKKIKSKLFKNLEEEKINFENIKIDKLTNKDLILNLIERYKFEIETGKQLIKEIDFFNKFVEKESKLILKNDYYNQDMNINFFVEKTRKKYWKILFENKNLERLFTNELRSKFYSNLESMKKYEFNLENIEEVLIELSKNMFSSLEKDIENLFDEFSIKYHYYNESSKNIHYFDGWKTNKAHFINKKVIIPLNAFSCYSDRIETYEIENKLLDIYKIFMYLDNKKENIKISLEECRNILNHIDNEKTKNIDLGYFTVSFYKKGTTHIIFNDEKLLLKFNIFGSQMKKWLPPSYGKTKYEDLDIEEKDVIDSFQGKESYQEVVNNNDTYLLHNDNIKLIGI
ncbi:DUF4942 domain-containing protein [Fusobacterium sp. SYSU M8D902]|uniref:DUF4942 domain-containing protein n=1 Tax=Fusobacterium sp. SYSU M8D902 TaxID=3159562 RepID=UPI0032E3E2E5